MALSTTQLNLPGQTAFYRGKVRDVYTIEDRILIMVASDRISAFDCVLPKPIPHKGAVLNGLAAYFLERTRDICPNWLLETPDPNVAIGYKCSPYAVEMVIRGYLAGHAWRTYASGERMLCGVRMPDGLKEGDKLPEPIITPTTKASEGHDEDISREAILAQGLVPAAEYLQMEQFTRALYQRGSEMAAKQGLILVDTKYEFGNYAGKVMLMDEIHTPDSSRYYVADGYAARQASGEKQIQLSKEFVREWLMANGFQGKEGQQMPDMPESFVKEISERYIDLYKRVTWLKFVKPRAFHIDDRIERNLIIWLDGFGQNAI